MKRYNHAVSEVLSMSLSVLIVMGTVGSVLYWGTPYIEDIKANAVNQDVSNKLGVVVDNIYDISHETPGSRRTSSLDVSGGSFEMNDSGDRLILSYTLDNQYSFDATGFNDNDNSFSISAQKMVGGSPTSISSSANVYWYNDDPVTIFNALKEFSVVGPQGQMYPVFLFNVSSLYSKITLDHLTAVTLRLTPVNGVTVVANQTVPVTVSHFRGDTCMETFSTPLSRFFSAPLNPDDALLISYPGYVESTNLLSLFENDYASHNLFFSLVLGSKNQISIDNIFFSSVFHKRDMSYYRPQLIVSYVSTALEQGTPADLNGEMSTQTPVLREDPPSGVQQDSLKETDSVHVYRSTCSSSVSSENDVFGIVPCHQMVYDESYDFQVKHTAYTALFQALSSCSQQHPIVVTRGEYAVRYTPGNYLCYVADDSFPGELPAVQKHVSVAQVDNDSITYCDQYGQGIDLRYTAAEDTVKEELVIDSFSLLPSPPLGYRDFALFHHLQAFSLRTGETMGVRYGENQFLTSSSGASKILEITGSEPVSFINKENQVVFSLPRLYAWDSATPASKILLERTVRVDEYGNITVLIRTPWTWLADNTRVYPVFIDDTVNIYNAMDVEKGVLAGWMWMKTENPPDASDASPGIIQKYNKLYTKDEYRNIESSEDKIYNTWMSDAQDYSHILLMYKFPLSESVENIRQIQIRWVGYCDQNWSQDKREEKPDLFLYIWKKDTWELVESSQNTKQNVELSGDYEKDFDLYLAQKNNIILLLVGGIADKTIPGSTYEDYVEVQVTSNSPPRIEESQTSPIPRNGATNQLLSPTLKVTVRDSDPGDLMTATFFLQMAGVWKPVGDTFTDLKDNTQVSVDLNTLDPPIILAESTTYHWKVELRDSDPQNDVVISTYSFTCHDPAYFEISSPTAGEAIEGSKVTCSWNEGVTSPNLKYHYMLEGYINQWSPWTIQESVVYYNLPYGDYTFILQGQSLDSLDPDNPDRCEERRAFTVIGSLQDRDEPLYNSPFTCKNPLQGTVRIDLYDGDVLFGRIYLFDLGLVKHTYTSMTRTDVSILENDALVVNSSGSESMIQPNGVEINGDTITLKINQMRSSTDFYQSGSGNLHFTCVLVENLIREMLTNIYELKIQVYGSYATPWLDYLETKGFDPTDNPSVLTYPVETSGMKVVLFHSLCKAGFW